MKYLHLIPNEKFTIPYINFVKDNFNIKEHLFYIFEHKKWVEIKKEKYIKICHLESANYKIWKALKMINSFFLLFFLFFKSKKIILHGLFSPAIILFLFLNPWYLKKCNWVIWGGDLYSYRSRNDNSMKRRIYYKIEDYVKRNMGGYITQIEGDYELAQQWYGTKGKYYDCFVYPSNLYKEIPMQEYIKDNKINIQIGNSADPSNNHFEIIDKLEKYKNENRRYYCILAYGDKEWAQKVCTYGKKKLGENFIPILDFMPLKEYVKFISKIDVAIFAHNRQQAVGNITTLLGMKKTVYLKQNVTTYKSFHDLGINLKSFEKLENIELLSEEEQNQNNRIIKERFSKEKLIEELENIFSDN